MDGNFTQQARAGAFSKGSQVVSGHYTKSYSSDYQADADYERSEEKQEQRDKVVDFILNNSKARIRYLGFPGKYWLAERALWADDYKAKVTGVEKNPAIFEKAKGYIPGWMLTREKKVNDRISLTFCSSRSALYFLGDLASLLDSRIRNQSLVSDGYRYGFSMRNAVWLDFTGPLSRPVWDILVGLNRTMTPYDAVICITLLYGRDTLLDSSGEKGRVEIIERSIPGFRAKDIWQYTGKNNSRMLTICGVRK